MHPDEVEAFLDEHLAANGSLPCVRVWRASRRARRC